MPFNNEPMGDKSNNLGFALGELRSVWAFPQSHQSLLCTKWVAKGFCILEWANTQSLLLPKPGALDSSWTGSFLAHLSRRLIGELIGYSWSGIRPSSTFSNFNISATSCPIVTQFYLKHHWVGGKDALDFGSDWVRTLVSMATESSHRVIMGKML